MEIKYWVKMTDKFLSGWGMAEGKKSVLVIECCTSARAYYLAERAAMRPEMKHIRVFTKKPRASAGSYVTTKSESQIHW